jgi:hypothetical protein
MPNITEFRNSVIRPLEDNFMPPLAAGSVGVKRAEVTVADAGTTKTLFALPKGAVIVAIFVNVSVVFNGDTTNTLDIGVTGSANSIRNDLTLASLGQTVTGWTATEIDDPLASDTTFTASVVATAGATTGKAQITFLYYLG